MTRCTRCRRNVTAPIFAGGLPFGAHCFRKVVGAKPRLVRKRAEPAHEVDPRQAELFQEVRP